jgi:hypothetical protein
MVIRETKDDPESEERELEELLQSEYNLSYDDLQEAFNYVLNDFEPDYFTNEQWEVCLAAFITAIKLGICHSQVQADLNFLGEVIKGE